VSGVRIHIRASYMLMFIVEHSRNSFVMFIITVNVSSLDYELNMVILLVTLIFSGEVNLDKLLMAQMYKLYKLFI